MDKTEVENRGIDEKLFNTMCSFFKELPSHQTMGINLMYLGKGQAGIKMSVERGYTTFKGRLHGGIIATMADTAMGWAVSSLGRNCLTVDMNLNYLTPVFEETELKAEGYVIHAGKTTAVAEGSLFNHEGKLVAKSRGTFFLIDLNLIGTI